MKQLPIIIGLVAGAITFYWLKARSKRLPPDPDPGARRPGDVALPLTPKQNDKLVLISGCAYTDLENVLTGFCNLYNKEKYQAQLRLTKISGREFAITFPFDIDFEIYCYLINYLQYPIEARWAVDVKGWATTSPGDAWVPGDCVGKEVMLFVPSDDTEHDNVYMTSAGGANYKLGFSMQTGKKLPGEPGRAFVASNLDLEKLNTESFEDFK
jgi:hypothetical protein